MAKYSLVHTLFFLGQKGFGIINQKPSWVITWGRETERELLRTNLWYKPHNNTTGQLIIQQITHFKKSTSQELIRDDQVCWPISIISTHTNKIGHGCDCELSQNRDRESIYNIIQVEIEPET